MKILIEAMNLSMLSKGILKAVLSSGSNGSRFDTAFMRRAKGGKKVPDEAVVAALNTLVDLGYLKHQKRGGATLLTRGRSAPATVEAIEEMAVRVVLKKLKKAGCRKDRQKGSHATLKCPVDKQTTVPVHAGGRDVPKGTLKSIEKQSGVRL